MSLCPLCLALQAQRDVYKAQLQKCQDTIIYLRTSYVDHARDLGKDNIIIVRKHTTPANIGIMTCHITLQGYNKVKCTLS